MSSDYSTCLGATTVKDSDYVTQNTQSRRNENLTSTTIANNNISTVHKDQLTASDHHKITALNKRNLFLNFQLCWTRNSARCNNAKSNAELSTTNGSAYSNRSKLKSDTKLTKKQRTKDCEPNRFQGIRVLFSKNRKISKSNDKKKGKRNHHKIRKQDIEVQLDEQTDEKAADEKNKDQILKNNNNQLNKQDCDIRKNKKLEQQKMRKSNTFSNLETVKNQQQQEKTASFEINNNQNDDQNNSQEKRRRIDKNNLKINYPPSLALLSPSSIASKQTTRRLSAHAEIQQQETSKTGPLNTSSINQQINSTTNQQQPVLVRSLGSSQVLTEQKATKVLGIVFFTFVFCWSPFFLHNFLAGVSPDLVFYVPPSVVQVLQWLGYVSSTLNPIIYTIFNAHFRRTFRKIILCKAIFSKHKLKTNSPRLAASRMVSFRGSSISRGQLSSIKQKKPPSASLN